MGFGTTNKMRVDDDELKLRQWVVELKNKGKNPEMIRDYLTQYQGYKTEAVQNAFNIAGMEYQPPEQTIQTPQATPQAQQQDPNQTYLGGQPFSIENSADFSLYQGEKEKQEEKSALVDFGLKAVDKKLTNIDKAAEHKSLDDAVGPSITKIFSRGIGLGGKQDFTGIVNQIVSVDALDSLIEAKSRGATFGALSDREMDLLKSAATKIGSWGVAPDGKTVAYDISEKAFKAELASMQESAKLLQQGLLEHKKEMEANPLVGLPKQAVQQEAQQGKQGLHLETPDDARKYLEANPDAPESAGIREKLKAFDLKKGEVVGSDSNLPPEEKEGFIVGSAKAIETRLGKVAEAYTEAKDATFWEKVMGRHAFRAVGQTIGIAGDVLVEGLKKLPEPVKNKFADAMNTLAQTETGQKALEGLEKYDQWAEQNPEAAKDIEAAGLISEIIPFNKLLGITKKAATATKKVVSSVGVPEKTLKAVSDAKNFIGETARHPFKTTSEFIDRKHGQILNKRLEKAGRLSEDVAKVAENSGFDEASSKFMSTLGQSDKSMASKMQDLAEDALTNKRAVRRPTDIVGENMIKKQKPLEALRTKFGKAVNTASKELKGKIVDSTSLVNKVNESIAELGIRRAANGSFDFSNSVFKNIPQIQKKLSTAFTDALDMGGDASKLHIFKKGIDEIVEFGTSGEGLKGTSERVLKNLRREADDILDKNFSKYKVANEKFKDVIEVLDKSKKLFGRTGINEQKAGQLMRRVFSNAASRGDIMEFLDDLDKIARKYKVSTKDNLLDQAIFTEILEGVYGTQAVTSLQGEVSKAIGAAEKTSRALRSPIKAVGEAAATLIETATASTDEIKKKFIREILKK